MLCPATWPSSCSRHREDIRISLHRLPCSAMPCHAVLCYAILCCGMLHSAMPCTPCHAHHAVLCCAGDHCIHALWACMLPELSVDAGGHDAVDMKGAHRVADVSGMQHCLHQQHPVFFLLHQEGPCSAVHTNLFHLLVNLYIVQVHCIAHVTLSSPVGLTHVHAGASCVL